MAAGGFAADEGEWGVEEGGGIGDEVFGGVVAVLRAGGKGVFGSQSVADAHAGEGEVVGETLEDGVLGLVVLENPPSAVDVHVDCL